MCNFNSLVKAHRFNIFTVNFLSIGTLRNNIGSGSNTFIALQILENQLAFSYAQSEKQERQRHVFIFTNGNIIEYSN